MKILLVVYDNGSYIHWFPQGPAYITAALENAGHEVSIWSQDVHHWPAEKLTADIDAALPDVVMLGTVAGYFPYKQMLGLAAAVSNAKHDPWFVLGGHGPSPEPEYFLRKCDADVIVIGEGDVTVVKLLEAIESRQSLAEVDGIAYLMDGQLHQTRARPVVKDVDSLSWPAYHRFPIEHYRLLPVAGGTKNDFVMPVLSGRGCPFRCNFCYRIDPGFRPRSDDAIIEELEYLQAKYGITNFHFADELLMSSVSRTLRLAERMGRLGVYWGCSGRLNYATPAVMSAMSKAGCRFVNFGIECMDNAVLERMHKKLTVDQIIKGIEATLAVGIEPGFNIIWGHHGDTLETLRKNVEFLLRYDTCRQMRTIRPVTPYPGCELYYDAIRMGLLSGVADFYDKHVNSDLLAVNFTDLSDSQFHAALLDANTALIKNYYAKASQSWISQAQRLYSGQDEGFRGFRTT